MFNNHVTLRPLGLRGMKVRKKEKLSGINRDNTISQKMRGSLPGSDQTKKN